MFSSDSSAVHHYPQLLSPNDSSSYYSSLTRIPLYHHHFTCAVDCMARFGD